MYAYLIKQLYLTHSFARVITILTCNNNSQCMFPSHVGVLRCIHGRSNITREGSMWLHVLFQSISRYLHLHVGKVLVIHLLLVDMISIEIFTNWLSSAFLIDFIVCMLSHDRTEVLLEAAYDIKNFELLLRNSNSTDNQIKLLDELQVTWPLMSCPVLIWSAVQFLTRRPSYPPLTRISCQV